MVGHFFLSHPVYWRFYMYVFALAASPRANEPTL